MQTPRRSTRSSVLGKRTHQSSATPSTCDHRLLTPEPTPNPKRLRVIGTEFDGDSNKENIAPFRAEGISPLSPITPRSARVLRRASTEIITPSRVRAAPRRYVSGSQLVPATLATPPSTPTSVLPIHSRARALLRSTCTATAQVAGRDQERARIQNFLANFLQSSDDIDLDAPTTLYISGSPGTGKTMLVNSILRDLDVDHPSVKVISLNCMAINNIDTLWDRLLEQFEAGTKRKTIGKAAKAKGREAIDGFLSSTSVKCILILDELDHVATTLRPLVSIFSLAQSHPSVLRVVGIANHHTLTSSVSQLSMHGVTGVDTLHFKPYTPPQLLNVLQARLGHLCEATDASKKFLPLPTLTLLTKKVASLTGDVRTLFEVLREAIDLSVTSSPSNEANKRPMNKVSPAVTPAHVLSALKAYKPAAATGPSRPSAINTGTSSNETVTKVKNLRLHARLALLSLILATKRLEATLTLSSSPSTQKSPIKRTQSSATPAGSSARTASVDSAKLHAYYAAVLTRAESDLISPVSRSEFLDLVGLLETVGLISALSPSISPPGSPSKAGRRALGRTTSLVAGGTGKDRQEVRLADGVLCDEALRGMGVLGGAKTEGEDPIEEEVRAIWERERARLKKDVNTKIRSGVSLDVFDDAMED